MGEVNSDKAFTAEEFQSVTDFSPLYRFGSICFYLLYAPLVIIYNRLVFGLRIEGREKLGRDVQPGCILISNHSLYLDPAVIIHTLFPRMCYYMALKSHFSHPVGGFFLRLMGGVPIPGVRGMRRAENTVRVALERGHCVHLFPEGEMTHMNQEPTRFRNGAFYLALRLGVPVVPVTLVHYPRTVFGRKISDGFIRVKCIVGDPIPVDTSEPGKERAAAARMAVAAHRIMSDTISREHRKRQAEQAAAPGT